MKPTPGPWSVYRCSDAPEDHACEIRGAADPNVPWQVREGHSLVVSDTNREECCHMMRLADAQFIVDLRNRELS